MRNILTLALVLAIAAPGFSAVDPEMKTPYQLQVVLRFGDHPLFTDFFKRELRRELQNDLSAAIGKLGTVEVVDLTSVKKDTWPALWKLADEKGLDGLETFNELGGGKTHFLTIDFADGQYTLRARQHDGATGFVTPLVRKVETHDRGFVTRLAGLIIGQDFGLVATLEPEGAGERAFLKIKGGLLDNVDRWVKPGEVFALVQIAEERRRIPTPVKGPAKTQTVRVGQRVDGVLLRVVAAPKDGIVECKIFHRYEDPLKARGLVGFRCVKLGTVKAPLRLRLLDPSGAPQKGTALSVHVGSKDYPGGDKEAELAIEQGGVFASKGSYENVAFVRVLLGNRRLARMPVEILDDGVATRVVRLDPAAELLDRIDSERRGMLTRITDSRLIQVRCFQDMTALELAGKKAEAKTRGQAVIKLLDRLSNELREELDGLKDRVAKEAPKSAGSLVDGEQQLKILLDKQEELRQHLLALQKAIDEENDPKVLASRKQVEDLVRAARLLITQAEYDQALAKYEEALAAAKDEPAAKALIEGPYQHLKFAWKGKLADMAHDDARKFIVHTWPRLATPAEVRDNLGNARKSFEKCKAVGDWLAVNKMQIAAVEVTTRFADELRKIKDAAMDETGKKMLEEFQKVNEDLLKLLEDVQAFALAAGKK